MVARLAALLRYFPWIAVYDPGSAGSVSGGHSSLHGIQNGMEEGCRIYYKAPLQ